ncbi:hypothetical protein [Rufibacter sp. LB8]|uniref:hypothetical protein n=1 Tax=Rufibacter sp. LB8 TaxID=2777781 RepID=UPI00178C521E|nr:hypothetical protein [Rufibacter sp. LB8]
MYGLITEEFITPEIALLFPVVSNFNFNHILESVAITDASGQESEVLKKWITFRWLESDENGFTPEQITIINNAKSHFNANHTLQIDFDVIGNNEWAIGFISEI